MGFFKILALSFLYPYGTLTSCKVSEKANEQFQRYLKTDGRTDGQTDGQTNNGDYHGPHRLNPGSKILKIA